MARPARGPHRRTRLHRDPPLSFAPDPDRLYEVGRDGVPYTLETPPPDQEAALRRRVGRWWFGAVLVNAATMGMAAAVALSGHRQAAAWTGLLPLLTAPLLLVAPVLHLRSARRRLTSHRTRPDAFPPGGLRSGPR